MSHAATFSPATIPPCPARKEKIVSAPHSPFNIALTGSSHV